MAFWTGTGNLLQPVLGAVNSIGGIRRSPLPVELPQVVTPHEPTPIADVDEIVHHLDGNKTYWIEITAEERSEYIRRCIPETIEASKMSAELAVKAKGSYGSGIGEEWFSVMPIVTALKEYEKGLKANGQLKPKRVYTRPNGQQVAEVFPMGPVGLLFGSFKGEVWIKPGKPATQGEVYRNKAAGVKKEGGVALVLGGGNQISVVGLDILYKLLVDDEVVVVKLNPVNDYLGAFFSKAFAPLVDLGVLRFVYGAVDQAVHLINHPLIVSIHLTGSEDTFNAIAWGSPSAERKGKPVCTKPFAGELGNLTPFIIVPGPWTEDDMHYHAEQIIAGKVQNCGHNCSALEVLVMPENWSLRGKFMQILKDHFNNTPQRYPYYPRSLDNWKRFKARFPQATELGKPVKCDADAPFKPVPYLLAEGLKPEQVAARNENWCCVIQEAVLPYDENDVAGYMKAAAKFCNEGLWGSLCCAVFIHPTTQANNPEAFDELIASLKYGCISTNTPAHFGYGVTALPWGGFPGNTIEDIGSGNCLVHNTMMFDHVEKGVVYGAWRYHPTPFWSNNCTALEQLIPRAMKFLANSDQPSALWYVTLAALAAVTG